MQRYKGTEHLGEGGGWPHFRRGITPSVWMQNDPDRRKASAEAGGVGWACLWTATAQLPGAVEAGKSSCSLPAHLGAFAGQLGAEWLCFSRAKLVPQHLHNWAVQTPAQQRGPDGGEST